MLSDLGTDEHQLHPQALLYRLEDHQWFAYGRRQDFIRRSDHTLWAHLRDGWLISARTGRRLAYQDGNIFYDAVTHEPVYSYESS